MLSGVFQGVGIFWLGGRSSTNSFLGLDSFPDHTSHTGSESMTCHHFVTQGAPTVTSRGVGPAADCAASNLYRLGFPAGALLPAA
jgi:hypothetical protein